jgi:16S rRNA (guanine527-N7)-methyltransferase
VKRPPPRLGERLTRLATRYDLGGEAMAVLARFLDLLATDPHAPTAVRDPAAAADVHLADSLSALPMLDEVLREGLPAAVADIGSGAGLPGIPLAVARPALRVDLVESTGRKCAFLRAAVADLSLPHVAVRCARAEELPAQGLRDAYAAVLVRAVASLATLVEYAGPLLAPDGVLIAWKGRRDPDEERAGMRAGDEVGLDPVEVRHVSPYEESAARHLHLYRKVRPCPPRFPRRPGVARKKPLA